MRGNVIELAVGVVIGAAFTAVVTAFSDAIINPLIAALGGLDYSGLGFFVREGNEATFVDFGAVLTAIINFLLIAAVIYFLLVAPMNKLDEAQKRRKGPADGHGAAVAGRAEGVQARGEVHRDRTVKAALRFPKCGRNLPA